MTYLEKKGGGEGDVRMLDPCGGRAEQRRRRRIYRVVAAARRASARGEVRARGVRRRRGVRASEGRARRAACERGGPGARRAVARRKRPSERNARAREKVRARGRFRIFIFVGRIGADENGCRIFVGTTLAHVNNTDCRRLRGRRKYIQYFRGPADEYSSRPTKILCILVGDEADKNTFLIFVGRPTKISGPTKFYVFPVVTPASWQGKRR
jgi:hypothetical protein